MLSGMHGAGLAMHYHFNLTTIKNTLSHGLGASGIRSETVYFAP